MLGGAGLKGRGTMSAIARQRLTAFPRSSRSISSSWTQRPLGGSRKPNQTFVGGLTWRATASVPGLMSARFNSTSSTSSPGHDGNLADPATQTDVGDISGLSFSDVESMPENIGYLKDLGLDYGWGPSSFIEFVIEHLHMWTGLPWWASIVGTGLLVRLALFYPSIGASDNAAKTHNLKDTLTPLQSKVYALSAAGNKVEAYKHQAELAKIRKENGIDIKRTFIPMLQVPLGFGCFRVVRGMTSLPVPGLASESMLWIKDLTAADPFFVLPALASLCMHLSIKKGGENGLTELQNTSMGKVMLYGLPALTFGFSVFFPSALQLYFTATAAFGLGQAYLINNQGFRRWANIASPMKREPVTVKDTSRGLRLLQQIIQQEHEKAIKEGKLSPNQADSSISYIDRMVNKWTEGKKNLTREVGEKMSQMQGKTPQANADGTPATPPRLSEQDRKTAADYERRRKEEDDWVREEQNHARRNAYLRSLEEQREKARKSWQRNVGRPKEGE